MQRESDPQMQSVEENMRRGIFSREEEESMAYTFCATCSKLFTLACSIASIAGWQSVKISVGLDCLYPICFRYCSDFILGWRFPRRSLLVAYYLNRYPCKRHDYSRLASSPVPRVVTRIHVNLQQILPILLRYYFKWNPFLRHESKCFSQLFPMHLFRHIRSFVWPLHLVVPIHRFNQMPHWTLLLLSILGSYLLVNVSLCIVHKIFFYYY